MNKSYRVRGMVLLGVVSLIAPLVIGYFIVINNPTFFFDDEMTLVSD